MDLEFCYFTRIIALVITLCAQLLNFQVSCHHAFTEYHLDFHGMLCTPISQYFGRVATRISCAKKCDRDALCVGFFHSNAATMCFGVDYMFSPVGCSAEGVNSTFRFYRNSALAEEPPTTTIATPTTTITTTTTTASPATIGTTASTTAVSNTTTANTITTSASQSTTSAPTTPPPSSTATNLYGSACSVDTDCPLPNSGCLEATCQCMGGYKFNPSTTTCVTACDVYGNTFIKIPGYAMMVPSIGTIPTGTKERDCVTNCTALSDCRSVNYNVLHTNCYFKSMVEFDDPSNFEPVADGNHYIRNCA